MKRDKPKYRQIIDAAVHVIAENGYHAAQVSKIAKQAGVADGTIYLYFRNKEDILISLFRDKLGEFIDETERKILNENRAGKQLELLIHSHMEWLSSNPSLAIVTQLELRQSNKEIRLKINEVLRPYLKLLETILYKGIESGEFRSDLPVRLARQMMFGSIDEVITNWVMKEQKYNLPELSHSVYKLAIVGLGTTSHIE